MKRPEQIRHAISRLYPKQVLLRPKSAVNFATTIWPNASWLRELAARFFAAIRMGKLRGFFRWKLRHFARNEEKKSACTFRSSFCRG